jgi:hypothetical protein
VSGSLHCFNSPALSGEHFLAVIIRPLDPLIAFVVLIYPSAAVPNSSDRAAEEIYGVMTAAAATIFSHVFSVAAACFAPPAPVLLDFPSGAVPGQGAILRVFGRQV